MSGRLLDVGCGDGTAAIRFGWPDKYDYIGLDVDDEKLTSAKTRGLDARKHNVDTGLDFPDNGFDKVVCKAILEHVEKPLTVTKECQRVVKPGGDIFVIVPSDRSYDLWGDYTHRRGFRKDALSDLLEDAGFRVVNISPRHPWRPLGAGLKSLGRILAPWTPYGYPRAWEATARKEGSQ